MKLVSLNIWGGKMFEPLIGFVRKQSADTEIFCFQEVFNNQAGIEVLPSGARTDTFQKLNQALPDFKGLFFPIVHSYDMGSVKVDLDIDFGLAIFINKKITISNSGWFNATLSSQKTNPTGSVAYANLEGLTVMNLHGLWTGNGKGDEPERLQQSENIEKFIKDQKGKIILCGDFNLNPDTQSLKILEGGLRNLIGEYKIATTRNHLYRHKGKMEFADYTLVSSGINVKNFQVPDVAVSDHLPMILEFD